MARKRGSGGRRGRPRRRAERAILFVTLGLVGAFAVSLAAQLLGGPEAGGEAAARTIGDPAQVRVEVLNAAGTPGVARDATHHLRTHGFDVVYFGNAPRFERGPSVVLDRVGDPARAAAVAAALGIDSVATARDAGLLLDVSVMLGEDWPPRTPERRSVTERLREVVERD